MSSHARFMNVNVPDNNSLAECKPNGFCPVCAPGSYAGEHRGVYSDAETKIINLIESYGIKPMLMLRGTRHGK